VSFAGPVVGVLGAVDLAGAVDLGSVVEGGVTVVPVVVVDFAGVELVEAALLEDATGARNGSSSVPLYTTDFCFGVACVTAIACAGGSTPGGGVRVTGAIWTGGGAALLERAADAPIGIPIASTTSSTTAGKICRSRRSASNERKKSIGKKFMA
jgi:hypothetical protein